VASPRLIPSVDQLLKRDAIRRLESSYGTSATREAVRDAADRLRAELLASTSHGASVSTETAAARVESDAAQRLAVRFRGSLRPLINATGVIVHTNLGRAPLPAPALDRLVATARGYCNLEYDLAAGTRGSRAAHAETLLTALTGAEAAVVVNNNAAAALLMLAALANGREAIVSRGELVEIGGGFRVPDVMAQSGARLREVGTTNRTRVQDYSVAIGPQTALILRVHPSNFRIVGFTERPDLQALVDAGHRAGVLVVEDLGSGSLADDVPGEPAVGTSLAAGVDLVCFSGDKLLGGPQAGVLAGRRDLVDRVRRHPLMRALRVDKLTYAALEGTLIEHASGRARETVPVLRMLHADADGIEERARRLADRLLAAGWQVRLVSGASAVGGGSAPGLELRTVLLALDRDGLSAAALESRLRTFETPIVARIVDGKVTLDLRTVAVHEEDEIVRLLSRQSDFEL
jgi:L-seryl-tRNA(Ser) seleniumtransferase